MCIHPRRRRCPSKVCQTFLTFSSHFPFHFPFLLLPPYKAPFVAAVAPNGKSLRMKENATAILLSALPNCSRNVGNARNLLEIWQKNTAVILEKAKIRNPRLHIIAAGQVAAAAPAARCLSHHNTSFCMSELLPAANGKPSAGKRKEAAAGINSRRGKFGTAAAIGDNLSSPRFPLLLPRPDPS